MKTETRSFQLDSKANDMAGLEEARALEYILPTDILRKEFRHNIEIIEKLILERADRADVPEPEQNRSKENTPDIQAYKLLLANNMKTVFTELQKIKADMNKAIGVFKQKYHQCIQILLRKRK